ncbi:hypothetical protein ACFR9U_05555 [Halorientalis brevis]|uniref:Uncharacterized protein n=1 Tax=Halorientalis brevis TaxID=1126241 RepID=A0ABD6C7Y7_9EURY|nr:hypothetical protein [Halorientalis brevis]
MYGTIQRAGYVALVVTPVALLVNALAAPAALSMGALTLEGGVLLVGGFAAVVERDHVVGQLGATGFTHRDGRDVVAVVAGAALTYGLSVHAGFGPVLASAAVGLAAGVALPEVDVPVYCGSFVGMASPAVFPSVASLGVAGVVAGLAFVAATESFGGYGGKLGTLALFGCLTTVALSGATFASGTPIQWGRASLIVPVTVVGAVATFALSVRFDLGAVIGSALVGVVAGVALPVALPTVGGTLAAAAFCASFVGMSSPDRLVTERAVALAGVLCGLVFVVVTPVFAGAGGKLGTVAFISCVSVAGASELRDVLGSLTAR